MVAACTTFTNCNIYQNTAGRFGTSGPRVHQRGVNVRGSFTFGMTLTGVSSISVKSPVPPSRSPSFPPLRNGDPPPSKLKKWETLHRPRWRFPSQLFIQQLHPRRATSVRQAIASALGVDIKLTFIAASVRVLVSVATTDALCCSVAN